MELMSSIKEGYASWLSSVSEINAMTIEQLEKITDKQMDSVKQYSAIGIQQLKGAQNIQGLGDVKAFAGESVTITGTLAKKMMEDGQGMAAMGNEYRAQLMAVMKRNLKQGKEADLPEEPKAK